MSAGGGCYICQPDNPDEDGGARATHSNGAAVVIGLEQQVRDIIDSLPLRNDSENEWAMLAVIVIVRQHVAGLIDHADLKGEFENGFDAQHAVKIARGDA